MGTIHQWLAKWGFVTFPLPVPREPAPLDDEADWEWEIAMARARAATDVEPAVAESAPEVPRTIIPVPTLPRASAASPVRPLEQPHRFPRATPLPFKRR
jgi:hypothetical protein